MCNQWVKLIFGKGNDSKDTPMFPGFWQQAIINTCSND